MRGRNCADAGTATSVSAAKVQAIVDSVGRGWVLVMAPGCGPCSGIIGPCSGIVPWFANDCNAYISLTLLDARRKIRAIDLSISIHVFSCHRLVGHDSVVFVAEGGIP